MAQYGVLEHFIEWKLEKLEGDPPYLLLSTRLTGRQIRLLRRQDVPEDVISALQHVNRSNRPPAPKRRMERKLLKKVGV